jgi:hypothetical protein
VELTLHVRSATARQRIIFALSSPTVKRGGRPACGKWGESSRLKRTNNRRVSRSQSRDRDRQASSLIGVHRSESSAVTLAFDVQIKLHPISLCRQAELIAG